jgi:hypothetical protein
MNRKKLINELDEVSQDMENFLGDSALLTAVKDLRGIQGKLDAVIGELQDEEDSKKSEEDKEDE